MSVDSSESIGEVSVARLLQKLMKSIYYAMRISVYRNLHFSLPKIDETL